MRNPLSAIAERVRGLNTRRELWLTYAVKALESYSYFSLSLIYVIFLTDNLGVSDIGAGTSYGTWGTLTVLWGIILGPAIDWLGVRRSLMLCFALEGVARAVMAVTYNTTLIYLLMYVMMPAAGSLGIPVMTISVKRYTTPNNRSLAFGIFYAVMNIAALFNGFIVDALRIHLKDGFNIKVSEDSWLDFLNDGNRLVIASGAFSSLLGFFISMSFSKNESQALDELELDTTPAAVRSPTASAQRSLARVSLGGGGGDDLTAVVEPLRSPKCHMVSASFSSTSANLESPKALPSLALSSDGEQPAEVHGWHAGQLPVEKPQHSVRALLQQLRTKTADLWSGLSDMRDYPGFWKYLVMALFMLNLKQIFRYLDSVLPKYMQRRFGCRSAIGALYSINPAMIIILVPLVAALTGKIAHFDMIHYGSFVSASSAFWIPALAGSGAAGPVMFVVQLSLGESIWSPRWYDYTMEVAPVGREGLFGALAAAPLFLAKLPTGVLSGFLLEEYCPNIQPCDTESGGNELATQLLEMSPAPAAPSLAENAQDCRTTLWTVIGVLTMMSPILVTAFRWWLKPSPNDFGAYARLCEQNPAHGPPHAGPSGGRQEDDHEEEGIPIAFVNNAQRGSLSTVNEESFSFQEGVGSMGASFKDSRVPVASPVTGSFDEP